MKKHHDHSNYYKGKYLIGVAHLQPLSSWSETWWCVGIHDTGRVAKSPTSCRQQKMIWTLGGILSIGNLKAYPQMWWHISSNKATPPNCALPMRLWGPITFKLPPHVYLTCPSLYFWWLAHLGLILSLPVTSWEKLGKPLTLCHSVISMKGWRSNELWSSQPFWSDHLLAVRKAAQ